MSEAWDLNELTAMKTVERQPRPNENTFSLREAKLMDREAKVLTQERLLHEQARAQSHAWTAIGKEQEKLRSAWINFHFTLWPWLSLLIIGTFFFIHAGNRHLPPDVGISTPNAITRNR